MEKVLAICILPKSDKFKYIIPHADFVKNGFGKLCIDAPDDSQVTKNRKADTLWQRPSNDNWKYNFFLSTVRPTIHSNPS